MLSEWINQYVHGLSVAEYHLQITLLAIFIGFVFYRLFKTYHRLRFINDTPTSRIASAAQGYVELKGLGELMPGPVITSPFSQRRCLWYQCIIEKRSNRLKHSYWEEESNLISDQLFMLVDDSGTCIIIPDGARVIPSEEKIWYGNSHYLKSGYLRNSSYLFHFLGFGNYRFTERLITVAEPLYVLGQFKSIRKTINPETLKIQTEALINTWKKNPETYLRQFDLDKNDKIQRAEWKLISQYARNKIRSEREATVHHTIQKPDERNQPFVISAVSEKQLLNKKRKYLVLYSILFFTLSYVLVSAIKAH